MNENFNLKSMNINELSAFIGFNTSKIRYYESELSIPVEKDGRGRRKYTENTIKVFLEIKALTSSGLKLEDIKNRIKIDTLTSSSSAYPKIEVMQERQESFSDDENQEKLSLLIKPFELQIKQQQDRIEHLLDRVETLQDDKANLKEEYQLKISDLIAQNKFYDLQLNQYKEKLEKLENKKWWNFWSN